MSMALDKCSVLSQSDCVTYLSSMDSRLLCGSIKNVNKFKELFEASSPDQAPSGKMAPREGLEPPTWWLTATRSTD